MKEILIVDDELCKPGNSDTFCREYPIEGVEYLFAGSEAEMSEILDEQESVSAIFLDIRFEGIGNDHGLSLLESLNKKGTAIPVIMMSSLSDAETIIKAWDLGADGYLVKWSSNKNFYADFKQKVQKYAKEVKPPTTDLVEKKRQNIRERSRQMIKQKSQMGLDGIIDQAMAFKESIGGEWVNHPPFASSFQNYVLGWNEADAVLRDAEENHRLLYLNMDFGDGCTLRCPHCFTHEGAIDARGRTPLPFGRLKDAILEAKELGLRCVRILGRGEPTQWVANPARKSELFAEPGGDIIDFVEFLHQNGIVPLVFSRGQIIGDDDRIAWAYGGTHGVHNGSDLVELLNRNGVSLFMGVSSIFPEVNNEMVGVPAGGRYNYDAACRRALKLAVAAGLSRSNPTRLAVEMPITNLNIMEMGVRYLLFQMLNISPCTNVYMVTGRAMTYGLGEISDPPQEQFLDAYAMVTRFAQRMGIDLSVGPYAGTKECHDVSCGMYLTLNGEFYPCPGYEGIHNVVGSLKTHSVRQIWENNPFGGHPQSICPPKIGTHFPPDFEANVRRWVRVNQSRYDDLFDHICSAMGINVD